MDFAFWCRVDVLDEQGCWNWMNQPSQRYGVYNLKRRGKWIAIRPHRYAWQQINGRIPNGLFVCHSCDNPRCCNPAHLWLGSNSDNQIDSVNKGRSGFNRPQSKLGEAHHSSKLTTIQVSTIRELYAGGGYSQSQLASQFGVRQTMISKIVTRQSWKHI